MEIFEPWLRSLAILAGFLIFKLLLRPLIRKLLRIFATKLSTVSIQNILDASRSPIDFLLTVLALFFALMVSPLSAIVEHVLMTHLIRSCVIISIFWIFFNLMSSSRNLFNKILQSFSIQLDAVLANILSTFLRFFILAIAFAMIVSEWGYDINGFIAGLSLGGLAVSLAAKDALANVFGSVIIIMDKPFAVGDWISAVGVEGTVENISLRSTRVRTYPEALVYIPNSLLANTPISNFSKRDRRRIEFTFVISSNNSAEKLNKCLAEIKTFLLNNPNIHDDNLNVSFNAFGENGFNIFIFCYTKNSTYASFLEAKNDINFALLNIVTKYNISTTLSDTNVYLTNNSLHPISEEIK